MLASRLVPHFFHTKKTSFWKELGCWFLSFHVRHLSCRLEQQTRSVSQLFSFSVMILSYACYESLRCGHLVMSNALIVLLCGGCRLFRTICQHGFVGIVRLIASNVSFVVDLGGLIHLLDLIERSASQSHWSLLKINWNLEVHDCMCKFHLAHYFACMCSWFSF